MKIFCHIPREDWFCDRFGREYLENSNNIVSHTNLDCDLIWIMAGWCWKQIPVEFLKSKKVVCTIHHEVPEKFKDEKIQDFILRDQFVDAYHVPCEQTANFISQFTSKEIKIIGYWCNFDLWKPMNREECKKKYNLPKDAFVIGSFQRDTEGSDLKSPKLEKGPDRFCEYVEKMKSDGVNVHVLLNGWRRQYIINRLTDKEIPFSYYELPDLEDICSMYCACDLYVVGSRYEGGPQAVLEAPATKTPIVSTDVGMASSVLPVECLIDMNEDYKPSVPRETTIEQAYENILLFDLKNHVLNYDNFFMELFEA